MPYDNLFAAALARKAKVQPDSVPVLPEASTSRSDILASVGAPMPEFNTGKVFQALDQPRNQLFKILSGIDKERVGGTDVLEKIGMKPGIGREALGLVMDTGADPMNALTGVPSAIKKIKDIRRLADLAKSTQTVAPLLNEGVSVARSNLLDAVESPAFQRQGRSVEGIEDLLGAQRSLADKTPMASPDAEFPKTPFEEIRPGSKFNQSEGQPEARVNIAERMLTARRANPEAKTASLAQELTESLDTPGAGMVEVVEDIPEDIIDAANKSLPPMEELVSGYWKQELNQLSKEMQGMMQNPNVSKAEWDALLNEVDDFVKNEIGGWPTANLGNEKWIREAMDLTNQMRSGLPSHLARSSMQQPKLGLVKDLVPKSGASVPQKGTVKTKKSKASDILTGQK